MVKMYDISVGIMFVCDIVVKVFSEIFCDEVMGIVWGFEMGLMFVLILIFGSFLFLKFLLDIMDFEID